MRSLARLLLAICFVSFSALTIYERASADLFVEVNETSTLRAQQIVGGVSTSNSAAAIANRDDTRKDECPCKQKSGSMTFACGVTLALSNDNLNGDTAAPKQAWFAFGQTDRNAQMMYLPKKPPRQIL